MRLFRRRTFAIVAVGICGVLLHACAGPTYVAQQYDGDPRPREEIAVVRVNAKDPVLLDSLDGEAIAVRLPEDSRLHVEILPGPHRVGVANALDPNAPAELVSFVAEAGKVYRPVVLANPPPASARIYEVDRDSDALVRDVTAAPKAPPRIETPPAAPAPAPSPPVVPSEPAEPDAGVDAIDAGSSIAPAQDGGVPDAGSVPTTP
jgi:hypothetical protein